LKIEPVGAISMILPVYRARNRIPKTVFLLAVIMAARRNILPDLPPTGVGIETVIADGDLAFVWNSILTPFDSARSLGLCFFTMIGEKNLLSGKGEATFRFYEELNDHLPEETRKKELRLRFSKLTTIKEAIECLRVPPAEVDLVLVNGRSVSLDYLLEGGDRVSVYPIFERFDISSITRVRERPLKETLRRSRNDQRRIEPRAKKTALT
jgi:hypothetical protein